MSLPYFYLGEEHGRRFLEAMIKVHKTFNFRDVSPVGLVHTLDKG
jgi:hypothetical protein